MSSKVVLRKNGGFYCVYGDDSFILYYLLNYRIVGDKVRFPSNALNKVINLLEDNHISYEVDGNVYDFKTRNKYKKFIPFLCFKNTGFLNFFNFFDKFFYLFLKSYVIIN